MNSELALEYTRRRMREMGHGEAYLLRFRHLVLRPAETREITAYNQMLLLISAPAGARIQSDVGLFDLSEEGANELQYEHRGRIVATNNAAVTQSIQFLQAIPLNTIDDAGNK